MLNVVCGGSAESSFTYQDPKARVVNILPGRIPDARVSVASLRWIEERAYIPSNNMASGTESISKQISLAVNSDKTSDRAYPLLKQMEMIC